MESLRYCNQVLLINLYTFSILSWHYIFSFIIVAITITINLQKLYAWDSKDEYEIHRRFNKKESERLKGMLVVIKRDPSKKSDWIGVDIFEKMKKFWTTETYKAKCEKNQEK